MLTAPIPPNEKERLAAVLELKILDTKREERFDRITKMALERFTEKSNPPNKLGKTIAAAMKESI